MDLLFLSPHPTLAPFIPKPFKLALVPLTASEDLLQPAHKTSRRVLQRLEHIEAMLKSVAPAKRQQVTR